MTRRRNIKWTRGTPLTLCPKCGSNSEPDFIDFSRKNKPAVVVMKCFAKGHAWGFEIASAKTPDGQFYRPPAEQFTKSDLARAAHGIVSAVCTVIIKMSEEFDHRMTGGHFDSTSRPRVAKIQWMPAGITLRIDFNEDLLFLIALDMPLEADEEHSKRLWKAAEIVQAVNKEYGGDPTPRFDITGGGIE